ncbi:MAG: dicarboxylate/amino acid:cation symporter [Spongiibacteraceae bacterium]|jgi:Na+/H+-dicarboxylate symporter|nr:dicarboxylate/amino acid:cation symporter [Spongiibacteraceae bacterium]
MLRLALHWQILIAIVLATVCGLWFGEDGQLLGVELIAVYRFLGTLFLNALKMLIVPLVLSSIIVGVGSLQQGADFQRLGLKTISFYLASSLVAILTGLLLVNLFTPGIIDGQPAGTALHLSQNSAELDALMQELEGRSAADITDVFIRMVPPNVVEAAASGEMLGLIFFGLLFGFYMARGDAPFRDTLLNFWQGVFDVMMRITMLVMRFAPLGVFGLVAKTVAATGFDAFQPLLVFFFTVLIALAIHAFLTLPLAMRLLAGVRPYRHLRNMSPALLTAFSTASSSASLPLTMKCVEQQSGVSNRTTSFVLPLGATINMDGTALYECVAAIFIAQAYGLDLSAAQQFTVVLVALLTSIGVAGIPAASLVAITVILGVIGLPLEGIGLLLVTDRILDMLRTAVNVFSDSCGAVIIARSEGEPTRLGR